MLDEPHQEHIQLQGKCRNDCVIAILTPTSVYPIIHDMPLRPSADPEKRYQRAM
jgi:hypothetical protein